MQLPFRRASSRAARTLLAGWQINVIPISLRAHRSRYTTVPTCRCRAAPEITGFYSSRPNLVADPNQGPRSAFQRLNPATQTGQFGSEGRNAVRGPGDANVDLSALKTFRINERLRLQFRAECFNIANPRTSPCRITISRRPISAAHSRPLRRGSSNSD
jgi:hypothetical protein